MYKLIYFVPESHLENTKQAIFATSAGELGGYSNCCWQVKGIGQFLPSKKTNPTIGDHGELTRLEEYRVEMLVSDEVLKAAIKALYTSHPYEVPAFEVLNLVHESAWS